MHAYSTIITTEYTWHSGKNTYINTKDTYYLHYYKQNICIDIIIYRQIIWGALTVTFASMEWFTEFRY